MSSALTTANPSAVTDSSLNASSVSAWLRQHPEFFVQQAELLTELSIPHHTGSEAVSLVERQRNVLREQRDGARQQLLNLVDVARENEDLLQHSLALTLDMLEADTLPQLCASTVTRLQGYFDLGSVSLILFPDHVTAHLPADAMLATPECLCQWLGRDELPAEPWLGRLPQARLRGLIDSRQPLPESIALLPLTTTRGSAQGILILGSAQADGFAHDQGQLFLTFISRALAACLRRLRDAHTSG